MIENFFKYLEFEKRYSIHTIRAYRDDLLQFLTFLKARFELNQIKDADHRQVRSWMVHMMQNDYSSKTINRKISSLKTYFKYLKKKKLVNRNPLSKIVTPKNGKRLPEFVRARQLESLTDHLAIDDSFQGQRNAMIITLLYQLGIRRAELIGIKDTDIDRQRGVIKVLGKGNKERLIPISASIISQIDSYLTIRDSEVVSESGHLLVTDKGKKLYPKFVYNTCKRYLSTVSSNEYLGPHILRHSFATHLANNGADLNAIKELMGHSSLAATQVYMHNTIDKLKEVYDRSHPKA